MQGLISTLIALVLILAIAFLSQKRRRPKVKKKSDNLESHKLVHKRAKRNPNIRRIK